MTDLRNILQGNIRSVLKGRAEGEGDGSKEEKGEGEWEGEGVGEGGVGEGEKEGGGQGEGEGEVEILIEEWLLKVRTYLRNQKLFRVIVSLYNYVYIQLFSFLIIILFFLDFMIIIT